MKETVRERLNDLEEGHPESFYTVLDTIMGLAMDVLLEKRASRGTANITEQGLFGVAMRLASDKMARIKHLAKRVTFERWYRERMDTLPDQIRVQDHELADLEDDLIDVINYAVILLTLLRGWWELPTGTDKPGERQDFKLR